MQQTAREATRALEIQSQALSRKQMIESEKAIKKQMVNKTFAMLNLTKYLVK